MSGAPELAVGAAVAHVARGGLLAFPTETSWGLAADARSQEAVASLRAFKGRASDRPLSVLVSGARALQAWLSPAPDAQGAGLASRLAEAFWPGPLTLIALAAPDLSVPPLAESVARADGAVGFRCSSHPDAQALAEAAEQDRVGPLTATSLNASGEPDIVDREAARAFCLGAPEAALLAGGECGHADPSSVLDCTTDPPTLLRDGPLPRHALERIAGPLAG